MGRNERVQRRRAWPARAQGAGKITGACNRKYTNLLRKYMGRNKRVQGRRAWPTREKSAEKITINYNKREATKNAPGKER